MSHDAELDDAAAMALGVIGSSERSRVQAHALECAECRREYAELRPVADLLGLAAVAQGSELDELTSARMRAKILAAAVRSDDSRANRDTGDGRAVVEPIRARSRSRATLYAVVAAAAAIALAFATSLNNAALRSENGTYRERVADLQTQLNAQAKASEHERALLAELYSPASRHFAVKGGEVVVRGGRTYLAMWALPPLPHGHVYQAWTKTPAQSTVAPSVTFSPNKKGLNVVPLPESAQNLEAVAVSVEPDGGSKAPTTTPIFLQKLS